MLGSPDVPRLSNSAVRAIRDTLGAHYWIVLILGQWLAWVPVTVLWLVVSARYYDASGSEVVRSASAAGLLTLVAASWIPLRARESIRVVTRWRRSSNPTLGDTYAAWTAATTSAYSQYKRDAVLVNVFAIASSCMLAGLTWHTTPLGLGAMVIASLIPAAFATVMGYGTLELLTRPSVEDISASLPEDFEFERLGLPLQRRLRVSILVFTSFSGIAVLGLLGPGGGPLQLLAGALVSAVVGMLISGWLDLVLSHGVTGPVEALRAGLQRVQHDDLAVEVPVTSSDELGELARAFNLMVRDLRERDRLQATFSTYLDKKIARIVMEDAIPEQGFEVDASILFCDVKGFTSFAESADPADVIARLNQVLALAVPIVEEHGGYVDKFIGDGLLAVFGAPGELADHADRAVSAAERITAAVRASGSELEMVAGVNTGRVVAGVVGAAGRLSFSVIGDTVNVAARVEAATRDTGDRVLITAATRAALARPLELKARGSVVLKGKAKPVELFAIP